MIPPIDLRIRVEAAFPGATIEADPEFGGDWLITPPARIRIEGDDIATISLRYDGEISGYALAATAETVGSSRRIRQVLRDMLRDTSSHHLLAARRRLWL